VVTVEPGVIAASPAGDIGWVGLATSLVMIAVAVAMSIGQRLGLERSILWATVRALAQLLAVGAVLGFILDPERPVALALLWVAFAVAVAAVTVERRAPEVPGLLGLAAVAVGASATVSLGVIFGLGVFPLEGRAVVPLAGMVIGNSLSATVVASRRIVGELSDKRGEVEARLALGLPWQDAARPHVRSALTTALLPQIETTKAVGLVALPGAMTGLILAGVEPVDAVKVQAAVMFLILGSVATTVTVVSFGLTRRLFTSDHRLVALRRT
jgi:putative ABC transport system permease protein